MGSQLTKDLRRFAAKARRFARLFARPELAAALLLTGCAMPSQEDPPNALSAPPSGNFNVAKSDLPPINPQQPPVAATQVARVAEPTPLSPAVPADKAEPAAPPPVALADPPQEAPPAPESLEEEDIAAIATAEPPPKEVPDGQVEASYSPYGIEITLGDGNMCVGDLLSQPDKLKAGIVFQLACSDDRTGSVRIDRVINASMAQASLKLGAAQAQKLDVTLEE